MIALKNSESSSNLEEDLKVLQDMYPEVVLPPLNELAQGMNSKENDLPIRGKLPFEIHLQYNDVKIEYKDQECIVLTKLPENSLSFLIIPDEYPNLKKGLKLAIVSSWMTRRDKQLIFDGIHREFEEITDCNSEFYDPHVPILMLIFSYLFNDLGELLFPEGKRVCQSESEYLKFKSLVAILDEDNKNRTNFNCCICMDTKKGKNMVRLPCDHYLCTDCIKSYYTKMIEEGRMSNVRCPECEYHELILERFQDFNNLKDALFKPLIPFEFFDGILSEKTCDRYRSVFYEQAATKLSKYSPYACVVCPKCETWVIKNDLDDPLLTCSQCRFTFCFDCLHAWHGYNNTCGKKVTIDPDILEEYIDESSENEARRKQIRTRYGKRILDLAVSDYLAEKLLEIAINTEGSDLQRCPKCRLVVQRSEGCNRMKCEVCGTLFCYLCGKSLYIDDCYEHFRDLRSDCYGRLFEGMPGAEDD